MKKIAFLFLLFLLPLTMMAQRDARIRGNHPGPGDRHRDFEQFLDQKCAAVVAEIGLSAQDSARFVPMYRELQQQKSKLWHKYGGARRVRRAIEQGESVADTTLMRVIINQSKLQVEDAQLQQAFIERVSKVLTPMQVYRLQQAEQRYKAEVMQRRNRENGPRPEGKPMRK